MTARLHRLFEYDNWANSQILANLETLKDKEQPLKYFSHVLGSQSIRLARLQGEDTAGRSPWPSYSVEECKKIVNQLKESWSSILNTLKDEKLSDKISYKNVQGALFESRIGDILNHVIIHSAYHRAQAAMATRSKGEEPAVTDFIRFARKF